MVLTTEYQLNLKDYRKASYFGLFYRHYKAIRTMIIVLALVLAYTILQVAIGNSRNYLVILIGIFYIIWALILFGQEERVIKEYIRSDDNILGNRFVVSFDKEKMSIELPGRVSKKNYKIQQLVCVFELSDMFLIYPTAQNVFILPKRVLNDEEFTWLRNVFDARLQERFKSRYLKKKGNN